MIDTTQRAARSGPWVRGGANPGLPSPFTGPASPPAIRWEVPLGAAITGSATLSPTAEARTDGGLAAFVGTHAGRFAGIQIDGENAGAIAVDLQLPGILWGTAGRTDDGLLVIGADDDHLYALDPIAGVIRWSQRIGACDPPRARGPMGTRCDPAGGPTITAADELYVGADGIYRLGPTGELRWRYPSESVARRFHVAAAPLVTREGEVYVGTQDGALIALDPAGVLRWRLELGPDVDASPVMLQNGWVVVGADGGALIAVDPSGTIRWNFAAGADLRAPLTLAADQTIYAATLGGELHAIAGDGTLRWTSVAGAGIASAPLVDAAGRIYFGCRDEHLYAISAAGRELWRVDLETELDAGPILTPDGTLIVGGDDGILRALAIDPGDNNAR